ncbi:MAG: exo-alpha-sialidase, partial [Verrucomicrobia bacterium]|nr:exo-alpha-sialidase [Verrucomicrobiota bacterium]
MRRPMFLTLLTGAALLSSLLGDGGRSLAADARSDAAPVDILEHRVPAPPPVGTRALDVGFEIGSPIGHASFMDAKDGRLMMIGSGSSTYSSNGGRTWTKPEKLPVAIDDAIRLKSGRIGGRAGMTFHVSEDE